MAGYNVLDDAKARNLGLDILEVKETEYAVVPVKDQSLIPFISNGNSA